MRVPSGGTAFRSYVFSDLTAESGYTLILQAIGASDSVLFRYAVDLTTAASGGSTTYTPINTASELASTSLSGNSMLMFDIDLTDYLAENTGAPIGAYNSDTGNIFSGVFHGAGHEVSKLTISASSSNYQGLFGYSSGTIHHLGVTGCNFLGSSSVGGLVGYNFYVAEISSCYSDITTSEQPSVVGGGDGTVSDDSSGMTTDAMKISTNYSSWDFVDDGNRSDDYWNIDDSETEPINSGCRNRKNM